MFSKKDATCKSKSGKSYVLEKQFKVQWFLSFHYASDKEGNEYIARVIDLSKITYNEQLLKTYLLPSQLLPTSYIKVVRYGNGEVWEKGGFEGWEKVDLELAWIIRFLGRVTVYTYRKLAH